jgi:hypothetical protein
MRKWWMSSAAALGAVLLACGSSDKEGGSKTTAGPEDVPAVAVPTGGGTGDGGDGGGDGGTTADPTCNGSVTLRLLGRNVGVGVSALRIQTGALQVTSGAPLAVDGAVAGPLDLALEHAHRLGIVTPPDAARAVKAVLPISAAQVAGTALTGDLDVCTTSPIEFTFDPGRVRPPACHVVVELDVARSVQGALGDGGGPFLLPQFKVVY